MLEKWLAALRSGDYQQGTGQLKNGDRYCCLGVACEISGLGAWEFDNYRCLSDVHSGSLPKEVQRALGLASDVGWVGEKSLVSLNDIEKLTFNQIADLIESRPEGLFNA